MKEIISTSYGNYTVFENNELKSVRSESYNYDFNKVTGFFARWGKTLQDDPSFSPFGPEILDLENSTICQGPAGKVCSFCYKANTPRGTNMSFEDFKTVFDAFPRTLCQLAIGSDASLTSNPDIWKMFDYCRNNGHNQVIPNVTVANINEETAKKLAAVVGAVSVSRYSDKNWCYDSIKRLTDAGLKQINIHQLLSQEAFDQALETIDDYGNDQRLAGLNAIVFLSLKQVGRGVNNSKLSQEQFKLIVDKSMEKGINFGFDSCSAGKFLRSVKDRKDYDRLFTSTEPCESLSFSCYVDVDGVVSPCSFTEKADFNNHKWSTGINMLNIKDFLTDVWYDERVLLFRNDNISNNRDCIAFDI